MSEDPGELEHFTRRPWRRCPAYDDRYETELVKTVETYLECDGNVTPTAERLFTHRHTVRYRLERVLRALGPRPLLDRGAEKLGLGLKAMRVLGIAPPRGPATEPGTEGGRVRAHLRGLARALKL